MPTPTARGLRIVHLFVSKDGNTVFVEGPLVQMEVSMDTALLLWSSETIQKMEKITQEKDAQRRAREIEAAYAQHLSSV